MKTMRTDAATLAFATAAHLPLVGDLHPLRSRYQPLLYRALGAALFVHLATFGGILIATLTRPAPPPERTVVVRLKHFLPPAPIDPSKATRQAVSQIVTPTAPKFAVPEPVPDWEAPPDAYGGPEEMLPNAFDPSTDGLGDGPVIVDIPSADPDSPTSPEDFIAFEEAPELILLPAPAYPELARQAGAEGTVMVRVFVGKDGKVHEAIIVESIPMLDDAALAAARGAVFKPALQQHKPVAVWVQIPMRFSLR
jgi:periplasmic protein TonB